MTRRNAIRNNGSCSSGGDLSAMNVQPEKLAVCVGLRTKIEVYGGMRGPDGNQVA